MQKTAEEVQGHRQARQEAAAEDTAMTTDIDKKVNTIVFGVNKLYPAYPFSTDPLFFPQLLRWVQERYTIFADWSPVLKEWSVELFIEGKRGDLVRKFIGRGETMWLAMCLAITSTKET